MPDKNYKRGCGKSCLRCWQNKLKHANPHVSGDTNEIVKPEPKQKGHVVQPYYTTENHPKRCAGERISDGWSRGSGGRMGSSAPKGVKDAAE